MLSDTVSGTPGVLCSPQYGVRLPEGSPMPLRPVRAPDGSTGWGSSLEAVGFWGRGKLAGAESQRSQRHVT